MRYTFRSIFFAAPAILAAALLHISLSSGYAGLWDCMATSECIILMRWGRGSRAIESAPHSPMPTAHSIRLSIVNGVRIPKGESNKNKLNLVTIYLWI